MKKIMGLTLSLMSLAACQHSDLGSRPDNYQGISDQTPTGSSAISADGLVAAYDFETYTNDGMLKDFGPFQNHGKVQQTQETDGLFGKARIFKTLEDVVDVPENDSVNLPGPLTIAAWVKLNTPNLHQHIYSCDDIYVLWTTTGNQYRLADTQANGLTTEKDTTPLGAWHSVVAVLAATEGDALNNDNIKIYIDGQEIEGGTGPVWGPATLREADGCLIGAAVSGSPAHQNLIFDGVLDELHVFSRALSETEIQIYSTRN